MSDPRVRPHGTPNALDYFARISRRAVGHAVTVRPVLPMLPALSRGATLGDPFADADDIAPADAGDGERRVVAVDAARATAAHSESVAIHDGVPSIGGERRESARPGMATRTDASATTAPRSRTDPDRVSTAPAPSLSERAEVSAARATTPPIVVSDHPSRVARRPATEADVSIAPKRVWEPRDHDRRDVRARVRAPQRDVRREDAVPAQERRDSVITVSIDRIEVRAAAPAEPATRRSVAGQPAAATDLTEYLRAREVGSS